ncbi:MAG: ATP-dependent helicase [Candidatus Omnitrophica bacterium]|nr:ATP-dependent helicase [Candidatus Omnitrophota bacterium]
MSNFERFYKELNGEQKKAVDAIEGPVLVLAGPGTGKTQLLSVRAANIICQKKALPENLLILTYTNAAAKTMKERLARIIGIKGYDVQVGTFHAFANSIILDSEEAANYLQDRIQITDIEKVKALEYILDHTKDVSEIRPFRAPYTYVHEIESRISELKREGISPEEFSKYVKTVKPDDVYVEEKHIPRIKALAVVYEEYEKLKEGRNKEIFDSRGRYDFDDMIMLATEALKNEKFLKKKYEEMFKFIMVDEFQDTNGGQLRFLFSLLGSSNPNLCCVGDDDQSIYRFQGASVGNFKELKKRFSKNLKAISLKKNYRSSKDIIDLAGDLIKSVPEEERAELKSLVPVKEFKKKSIESWEFTTEEEELCFLVERIKAFKKEIESSKELSSEERGFPYNNIAVLVRKRNLIPKIIDKFLQSGIPYSTDGKEDIRPEPRVRQMLDILELANLSPENFEDRDRVLYKALISDYFKIKHKDILKFMEAVNKKKKQDRTISLLSEFLSLTPQSPEMGKAVEVISRLLQTAPHKTAHTVLMDYIKDAGIFKFILEKYDKKGVVKIRELRSLASFVNMVKEADLSNPGMSLTSLVEDIKTRNEHNMPVQGELVTMTQDGVRIFTAHGSKGQEFHSVIIPFCLQDKSWPIKPRPATIPLPPELLKTIERVDDKARIKQLQQFDETRLFYVALSRAKNNVLFTASPGEKDISSSFLHHLGIETRTRHALEERILEESLKKTEWDDPFIGTEVVLKDMLEIISLNPTSLNNYLRCRRKFLYDNVLMLPGPKKQSLIFGNSVHNGLEQLYRQYMRTGAFPDFQFFKEKFLEALKFQGLEKAMELRCMEQFEGLRKYYDRISSNPIKPLGLENRIPVNIDGIVFTGKYDKLELEDEENGFVRVVDYKTGQAKNHAAGMHGVRSLEDDACDEYLRQLVCYKLLYERDKTRERKDLSVSHGVLVFVEPAKDDIRKYGVKKGEPSEFKIEINEDMVDEMVAIIKNVWRDIQALRFEKLPERDKKKCGYCDFDYICWG